MQLPKIPLPTHPQKCEKYKQKEKKEKLPETIHLHKSQNNPFSGEEIMIPTNS